MAVRTTEGAFHTFVAEACRQLAKDHEKLTKRHIGAKPCGGQTDLVYRFVRPLRSV